MNPNDFPCRNSIAEAEHDRGPIYDKADIENARQYLTEQLISGKKALGFFFYDVLDCELNSDRYKILLQELDTLLNKDGGNDTVSGCASNIRDGIIERFLDTHADKVEELAVELAAEEDC